MSVILSDARRSAATKRESKNPEDFSFIHTASGSSHNTPHQMRRVFGQLNRSTCCYLEEQVFRYNNRATTKHFIGDSDRF
jgi:hypothetical protein